MDVLLLSRLLKELIIDNDRIPLPGMGYFITEPMPAYFSEDGKTIYPPSKRISFKGDDRAKGNLVAQYYAAGSGIDEKTAIMELEAFLQQLKITLKERKNIDFPGLGRLRSTLEGNSYFVAEQNGGIFAQAFGFEPVILKPVNNETDASQEPGYNSNVTTTAETMPEPYTDTTSKETQTDGSKHKSHRILFIILGILAALIIAAVILVELGRSGKLDHLIYSDEELELLEQHGM